MSHYSTLLGSYRMSASSQVLPPAGRQQQRETHQGYSAASSSSYYQNEQAASSSNLRSSYSTYDRMGAAARANLPSATAVSNMRPRSSSSSVGSKLSSSSSSAYAANNSIRSSTNHYEAASTAAPSTIPQTYLSTSSSSSSSSHYYYPQKTQQKQQQQQVPPSSTSSSSSSSTSILTQAQRTSGGSSSSKNANVINNAHHHRLRSSMYKPKWDPALPRTRYSHRPLLLLDLDETLVHATTQRPHSHHQHQHQHDLHFHVDMGPNQAPVPVWVALRPGAKQFVADIAAYFEIAVFTASIKNYADKVCECLDPTGTLIHHRLYRDHCSDVDGVFVKDLSLLNRPLHRVSILDNSPHAYLFHPENSIPILSWFDDVRDNELPKMLPMLIHHLAQSDECYGVLENYRNSL